MCGLVIKIVDLVGEEFFIFCVFWVEKLNYDINLIVVYVLLDSLSVFGVYCFFICLGENICMDVEVVFFLCVELSKVGLVLVISMFMYLLNGCEKIDDFCFFVYDFDGLLMINGCGECLWCLLVNFSIL